MTTANPCDTDRLALKITDTATDLALELLSGQNAVTERHARLVRAMAATTADCVLGRLTGRYAIVAPVGAAKTTTLACVARAVQMHAPEDVGMLLLQERVAAGAETVERLMVNRLGMERDQIAHVFRRDADGNEGTNPEDAIESRFVVATHARAQMRSIVPLLTFRGRPRAALVDEVLYAGHGTGSTVRATKSLLGWLLGFEDDPNLRDLAEWASTVRDELRAAVDELRSTMTEDDDGDSTTASRYIDLTAPYAQRSGYWAAGLRGSAGRKRSTKLAATRSSETNIAADAVRLIESLATSPEIRLVVKATSEEGGGILQHRRVLPKEMTSVLVFDAGAEIDPLLKFDDELKLAHVSLPHFANAREPQKVKDWRRVSLHWLPMPGGKDRLRKTFAGATVEAPPWPTRAAAEFLVKMFGAQPGPVLVVAHKESLRLGATEHLRRELEGRGFDWKRVRVTTWGQADASNAYQDTIGGVLLGVMRLPRMNLQAMALAQTSQANLRPAPTPEETTAIDIAQTASRIYQAVGRCRSRQNGAAGVAKASKWLVINWERAPIAMAAELMPGAQVIEWSRPAYAQAALRDGRKERRERDHARSSAATTTTKRAKPTKTSRTAVRIIQHLEQAAEFAALRGRDVVVPKSALMEMARADGRAFRRALRAAEGDLERLGVESSHRGVRVPSWTQAFVSGGPD